MKILIIKLLDPTPIFLFYTVSILFQLLRGVWAPTHSEILRPSFTTKACVIASVLLTFEKSGIFISLPHEISYLVSFTNWLEFLFLLIFGFDEFYNFNSYLQIKRKFLILTIFQGLLLFFVYFKLSALLLNVADPLLPFENLFCAVFMGGIWDALTRFDNIKLIKK